MELYFVRHGIAEDRGEGNLDAKRKLTDKGIAQMRLVAQGIKALGIKPDRLYSSPLVRARETAEIVAEALGVEVQIREALSPGFDLQAVETLIADLGAADALMFVGHEPDFSTTISALIGGRESVVMKKGGLARIDLLSRQPLRGELAWLIAPKVFEALTR